MQDFSHDVPQEEIGNVPSPLLNCLIAELLSLVQHPQEQVRCFAILLVEVRGMTEARCVRLVPDT